MMDDDDFSSFRGITCKGHTDTDTDTDTYTQTHTHTHTHTHAHAHTQTRSRFYLKVQGPSLYQYTIVIIHQSYLTWIWFSCCSFWVSVPSMVHIRGFSSGLHWSSAWKCLVFVCFSLLSFRWIYFFLSSFLFQHWLFFPFPPALFNGLLAVTLIDPNKNITWPL